MRPYRAIALSSVFAILLFLIGCQRNNNVCPPKDETEKPAIIELADLIQITPSSDQSMSNVEVQIGRKTILVDKYITGPICNDDWRGTVYVGCDAQVAEAELDADANPLFFKGCNLNIEPNTVVYVAAHNNEAFYKGCSCHTGGDPIP